MRRLVRSITPTSRGHSCTTSFSPEDGGRPFDSGLIAGKRALPFLEKKELRSKDLIRPRLRRLSNLIRYGGASTRGLQSLRGRNRAVEKFDYVENFLIGVVQRGTGAELQQAAGVGGDD